MQFEFTLIDNNKKAYGTFLWFLLFLHLAAVFFIFRFTENQDTRVSLLINAGLYLLATVIFFLFRDRKKALDNYSFIMGLVYANFWIKYVGWLALLLFLGIYMFVYAVYLKKSVLIFDVDSVQIKRLIGVKKIDWHQLDNVVLKDNLLTVDFKNNRLLQVEIYEKFSKVEEVVFNRFCDEQLKKQG